MMNLLSSVWLIHFLFLTPCYSFQNSNRRETQHYAVQPLRIDQTMLPAPLNEKEANRFTRENCLGLNSERKMGVSD